MSHLTFQYDESYYPAFPAIEAEVDGYDDVHGRQTINALLDSGADGTMIPSDVLQAVGAKYEDTVQMYGTAGGVQTVDRYTVAIQIGLHLVQAVHAVAIAPDSEAVLGRDVINELAVLLNGPAHMTEIIFDTP